MEDRAVTIGSLKYVLLRWLQSQRGQTIAYHDIFNELPAFEKYLIKEEGTHEKIHGLERMTRTFRDLKSDKELLKLWDLTIEKVGSSHVYDLWSVESCKKIFELETV